jgi:hypothetical protein
MNMTIARKSFPLAGSPRNCLFAAALAGIAIASGCMSSEPDPMAAAGAAGAVNTGTYPNLNVAAQVAAQPMTDDEAAGLKNRVQSARSRQAAAGKGAGTTGDPVKLKKLAESHGPETLKQIEGQQ